MGGTGGDAVLEGDYLILCNCKYCNMDGINGRDGLFLMISIIV